MAQILALQGQSNVGKTTTLIKLLAAIQAKYPRATVTQLRPHTKDILVVIDRVTGQKIGIESRGDDGILLMKGLQVLVKEQCDIIFCACRTRGSTVKAIEGMCPPYTYKLTPKTIAASANRYAHANNQDVVSLMRLAGI